MNVVKDMIAACEGLLRAHRLTFRRPPQTVEQAENELAEIHAAVATAEAAIQQAKDAPWVPDEAQLKAMVDRFLAWPVPNDFAPDAGISFVPPKPGSYGTHWWPIGTNLMTAEQAMQMFRNCTTPDSTPNAELTGAPLGAPGARRPVARPVDDVLGHCWRSEMELPTDEDWRDHAEIARQDALDADAARPLLERLREAEADYTVTYGSGELYGEAADVLDAARRLWPLIERSTKGLVFTADRAGEVASDMAALRKALVA